MTITSYDDLSTNGKIVYVRFLCGSLTEAQLTLLVSKGKITQEEADFMIYVKNN